MFSTIKVYVVRDRLGFSGRVKISMYVHTIDMHVHVHVPYMYMYQIAKCISIM